MEENKEELCGLDWNWRHQYDSYVLKNIYLCTNLPPSIYLSDLGLKVPRSNKIPEKMSTSYVQTLTPKYHSPLKWDTVIWRNGWFWGWDREGIRWPWNMFIRKWGRAQGKKKSMSKGPRNHLERGLSGQIWHNLSDKVNKKSNW